MPKLLDILDKDPFSTFTIIDIIHSSVNLSLLCHGTIWPSPTSAFIFEADRNQECVHNGHTENTGGLKYGRVSSGKFGQFASHTNLDTYG
jgi:hypothetical protein